MTVDDESLAEPIVLGETSGTARREIRWDSGPARRCLGAAIVIGVLVDQATVTDPNGLAGTVAVVAALTALFMLARPTRWARLWAVLAIS